jgi:hypothetical protein
MNTNEKRLDQIKNQLLELYRQLPDQFALENVKLSFKKTLQAINEVQTKRQKRYRQNLEYETQNRMGFQSVEAAQKALEILDGMLANEQKNIDQAQQKPEQLSFNDGLLNG